MFNFASALLNFFNTQFQVVFPSHPVAPYEAFLAENPGPDASTYIIEMSVALS